MRTMLVALIGAVCALAIFTAGERFGANKKLAGGLGSMRYEMHVTTDGRVYTLDKHTGKVHVNYRDSAGYLPDVWPPIEANSKLDGFVPDPSPAPQAAR